MVRAPLTRIPRFARNPTSPQRGEVKEVRATRLDDVILLEAPPDEAAAFHLP
jgi:hypothetical protein